MKIGARFGQVCKTYEAAYVMKLAEEDSAFPAVMLNVVAHPDNLNYVETMVANIRASFPTTIVNMYFAQSSPWSGASVFLAKDVGVLEHFIDNRIAEHVSGRALIQA